MLESWRVNTSLPGRFLTLSAGKRRLVIEAFVLQASIAVALRVVRFGRLRRLLARVSRAEGSASPNAAAVVERVAWAVSASSRYLGGASTCFTQSLAAAALLGRRGCPAQVAIGVLPPRGDRLQAHAWVEREGSIVVGARDPFTLLARVADRPR